VVDPRLRGGDVVVTIGAGDIFKLADALTEHRGEERPMAREGGGRR
jgi:hypothetical protein